MLPRDRVEARAALILRLPMLRVAGRVLAAVAWLGRDLAEELTREKQDGGSSGIAQSMDGLGNGDYAPDGRSDDVGFPDDSASTRSSGVPLP